MATFVERPCRCGGVGCGGTVRARTSRCHFPTQRKPKLCAACYFTCRGHYDDQGTNIPSPSCKARPGYDANKKLLAA